MGSSRAAAATPRTNEARHVRGLALALHGAVAVATGCGDSAILLTVSSDLEVPAQLDAICLSVADESPAGGAFSRRYALAERGLPQTLAVEPGRAAAGVAQVRGQLRGREIARARATFSFGGGDVELPLAACVPGDLGAPDVAEVPGAPTGAVALSRGARGDLLVALGSGEARAWLRRASALDEVEGGLPEPPSEPRAAIAADVNASCEDDVLVVSERGIDLWTRDGEQLAAVEAGFLDAPADLVAIAAADLDGDGAVDVVAGGRAALRVYRNDGTGSFSREADAIPEGAVTDVTSIALADVSGDGLTDILVGQGAAEPAPLVVLVADAGAGGDFAPAPGAAPETAYEARRVVAVGAPGAPADALVATDDGIVHLVNRGDGRLDDRAGVTFAGADGTALADVAAGDWDGDCRTDAIVAPAGADVRVWTAEDGGRFSGGAGISAGGGVAGARLILDDLGEGRRDLVITGDDGVLWVTR